MCITSRVNTKEPKCAEDLSNMLKSRCKRSKTDSTESARRLLLKGVESSRKAASKTKVAKSS